ncbi:MAG: T9SS type A sorting domain-containing protein [Vicingus serpentipes]|nr:T9SS type A sorting domain-containing protein [Vicingus serpentipes]
MKNLFILILLFTNYTISAQNTNLSNGFVFDGEPYITVNPNNSQHLVVAWMGWKLSNQLVIKTRTSFDAGQTWSTTTNVPHVLSTYTSADPSLAFDNNGNLFLCFIDHVENPITGGVYVVKSTDGGLNWGTPTEVINVNADGNQFPIDRPWIAIDNSGGSNDGNIYVTSMSPDRPNPVPPYHPYLTRSTDGAASFDAYRYTDTSVANYLAGNIIRQPMSSPTVSADGTLHIIYPSYMPSQSLFAQYILATSNDAGNTFTYNYALSSTTGISDTLAKAGYLLKSNPADANHLALFYPQVTNGDLDIFMVESTNKGINWSAPIRINDDAVANNRMQDLVWADFDTDGDLIVTWRDRRNANDSTYTVNTEIYGAVRWKDSTNFSANFPITDSSISYNAVLSQNGNDFMSVNMVNDTAYAVWGDTRNGYLNIWFQQIDLATGATSVKDLANDITSIQIYPNPIQNQTTIDFGDNHLTNAYYEILNALGEVILHENVTQNSQVIDLSPYAKGSYFIRFTNDSGSQTLKMVKQ